MVSKINQEFFFEQVKGELFGGSLKQKQVDGMTALLDYWEVKLVENDDRWLAYVLATTFHETAFTMQPIKEYGSNAYFMDRYDKSGSRPQVAKALGNTEVGDGKKYPGRGYVQLTGRKNYREWNDRLKSEIAGIDLVGDPDQALRAEIATPIIFEGMRLGTFTSKKLSNYFKPSGADWVEARRIVNSLDKAHIIASYGRKFYAALSYTTS